MGNSCHSDYSLKMTKRIANPKDLKKQIKSLGMCVKSNRLGLNSIEYVDYYQMFDGKPLRRVYAYAYSKPDRVLHVKEVARYYDHRQYLNYCLYCIPMAGKRVDFFGIGGFTPWPDKGNSPSRFWKFWPTQHLQRLDVFLRENNLPYTGWDKSMEDNIYFDEYITVYLENPKIELLSKAGFGYWVRYLKYLDTSKKLLHEIFKIKKEAVPLLQDSSFNYQALMVCRKTGYTDMNMIKTVLEIEKIKQYFILSEEINSIINQEKTVKYVAKLQNLKSFIIQDYVDYLRDLQKLGAINDPKAIYPKAFKKAHKETAMKIKLAESQKLIEGFKKNYQKHKKYIFEGEKYLIRPVIEPKELYKESEVLGHCVRTYDENVAAGTTEIMFIRKKNNETKPFYTLELKKKKVIQVRGKYNEDPTKSVIKFVEEWSKKFKIRYKMNAIY